MLTQFGAPKQSISNGMWRINSSSIVFCFVLFVLKEKSKISFNLQFKHPGFLNYQNSRRIEKGGLDFTKILLLNGVEIESTHFRSVF